MSNLKPPPIYRIIVSQFAATFSLAIIMLVITNETMAYSAFIGGLICAVANGYFAKKTFTYVGANSTTKMIKSIYLGEFIKLLLITAGFAVAFVFVSPLNILLLFAGFLVVHLVGIVAAYSLYTAQSPVQPKIFNDS